MAISDEGKPDSLAQQIDNLYKIRANNLNYLVGEQDPQRRVGIQAAIDNAEHGITALTGKPFVAPEIYMSGTRAKIEGMLAKGMTKEQIVDVFRAAKVARQNAELYPSASDPSNIDTQKAQQLAQIPGAAGAPTSTAQPQIDIHAPGITTIPTIRERLQAIRDNTVYHPVDTLMEATSSLINDLTGVDPSGIGLPARPRSMDSFMNLTGSIAMVMTGGADKAAELAGPLWKAAARSPFMSKLLTAAKAAQPYAISSAGETKQEGGGIGDQLQSYAETVGGFLLFETALHGAGKVVEAGRNLVGHFETAAKGSLDNAEKSAAALLASKRPKAAAQVQATALHDAAAEGMRVAMTKATPEEAQAIRENLREGIGHLVDIGSATGHDMPHTSRIVQAGAKAALDMPATKSTAAALMDRRVMAKPVSVERRFSTPAIEEAARLLETSEVPSTLRSFVEAAPELEPVYQEAVARKNQEMIQDLLAQPGQGAIPLQRIEQASGGARADEAKRQAINAFVDATRSQTVESNDGLQIANKIRSMSPDKIHDITRAIRMAQRVGGTEADPLVRAQLDRLSKRELGTGPKMSVDDLLAKEGQIPPLGDISDEELFRDIQHPGDDAARPVPPPNAAPSLSDVRTELASRGIDLRVKEGEGARSFQAFDASGKPMFETRSLQDALYEAQRRNVPTPEALAPTLVDPQPTDSDAVKVVKTSIRRGSPLPPPPGGTGGVPPIPPGSIPGGNTPGGRFSEPWLNFTRAMSELGHKFRSPDELVRNLPTLKDPVLDFGNAHRAMSYEVHALRDWLDTAVGLKENSVADQTAAVLLDGTDGIRLNDRLAKGDRDAWKAAIMETARTNSEVTVNRTRAALDALDNLDPKTAKATVAISKKFRELRQRGIGTWARETFPEEIGRLKPWVVFDSNNKFIERYPSQAQASRAAAKLGMTASVRHHLEPTPTEINNRFGSTLSAYFPHLAYDQLDRSGELRDLVGQMSWADPTHLANDLKRVMVVKDPIARRAAFEELFGPMPDDTYASLDLQARHVLKDARGTVNEIEMRRIPRDLYVRFYNRRSGIENYQLSAVNALKAYAPPVLRDIHLGPEVPKMRAALESSVAAGVDRGILNEVKDLVSDALGHKQPIAREATAYASGLTRAVYNGVLLGRIGPAISNIVGQTFQVGLPEMGMKHAASALVAMSDGSVRAALASIPEIRSVIPAFTEEFSQSLANLRENPTNPKALRNVVAHAGDFMQMGESALRMWAYLGGVSEKMEQMQLGQAGSSMKALFSNLEGLPQVTREDLHRAGTDMIRRVAFFFEPQSLPKVLRATKKIPVLGPPATMFMNFPVNYGNRLLSNVQDAFNRALPKPIRLRAQGKLVRMAAFTTLIAGPLGAPIVNEWIDSASELDTGTRGKLKRFLLPYQDYWTQTLHGASVEKYSMLRPLTELGDRLGLSSGNVISGNPVIGPMTNLAESFWDMASGAPITSEVQAQRQRVFGDLSPYVGVPKPEMNHLPEMVASSGLGLGLGGGAWQDLWNYFSRRATADALPGPIDARGKARPATEPFVRSFFGQTREEREARKNIELLKELQDERGTKLNNYLVAIMNPRAGAEEQMRSLKVLLSTPEVIAAITPQAIERARLGLETTPEQQTIASTPVDVLRRLDAQGVFDGMLRDIGSQPPEIATRRLRAWMTAKERLATAR